MSKLDKNAFFINNNDIAVLSRHNIVLYNMTTEKYNQILFSTTNDTSILISNKLNALSPEYRYLAFIKVRKKIYSLVLYDLKTKLYTSFFLDSEPYQMNFIDDQNLFISSKTGDALFYNYADNKTERYSFTPPDSSGQWLAYAPTKSDLILLSNQNSQWIDRSQDKILMTKSFFQKNTSPLSISSSFDGRYLSLFFHDTSSIYDIKNKKIEQLKSAQKPDRFVFQQFSRQGEKLAILCDDILSVWDVQKQKILWSQSFKSGKYGPIAMNFSPDGNYLMIGGARRGQVGALFIYNSKNGRLAKRMLGANDY